MLVPMSSEQETGRNQMRLEHSMCRNHVSQLRVWKCVTISSGQALAYVSVYSSSFVFLVIFSAYYSNFLTCISFFKFYSFLCKDFKTVTFVTVFTVVFSSSLVFSSFIVAILIGKIVFFCCKNNV